MPMSKKSETLTRREHEKIVAETVEDATAELKDRVAELQYNLEKLQRMFFGRSSEKLTNDNNETQQTLFEEPKSEPIREEKPPGERKKRSPGKPRYGAQLERKVVEVDFDEEPCCVECNRTLKVVGVEKSEKLEFIPATVRVLEFHRKKYACSCKQSGVRTAPVLPTAFPKSAVTDETRAHFLVQKFVDHLPYYRQSKILKRSGVELSDSSIGHYVLEAADLLAPIMVAMRAELLKSRYLQVDETTFPVLKTETSKPGALQAYLWTYGIPWSTVIFDYRRSRSGKHPAEFLGEFEGVLQSDRYAGYNAVRSRDNIIDVACWAHARRKFIDAQSSAARRVKPILQLIGKLYTIENQARERRLSFEERRKLREELAAPVLEELRELLVQVSLKALPQSPLGKAAEYTLGSWEPLIEYVKHGEVEIDTNLLENSIRPVALGRKNYLFAGSDTGAEAAATIYSLTETCRRLEINPYNYLVEVFRVKIGRASCRERV